MYRFFHTISKREISKFRETALTQVLRNPTEISCENIGMSKAIYRVPHLKLYN